MGFVGAVGFLALDRTHLLAHNLFDTTTNAEYIAMGKSCEGVQTQYRQIDGTCTDLQNPAMGSLGMRFGRNVPLAATFTPSDETILSPNPRVVAEALLHRKNGFIPATTINMLAAAHIQFNTHDWFTHGTTTDNSKPFMVPIPEGDPLWANQTVMPVGRTLKDTTRSPSDPRPATYTNYGTHWWDLHQIYGTTAEVQNQVRSHTGGKLNVDAATGLLPLGPNGIEITGFNDNWWTGLSIMHNLWVREHNHICEMLAINNPTWDDEHIFQVARLINSALQAKIHTVEWTPALLGNDWLRLAMHSNWYGTLPKAWQSSVPAGLHNEYLTGIVGMAKPDFANVNFTLTEEFVSVYRFHSLLPDDLTVLSHETNKPTSSYPLEKLTFRNHANVLAAEKFDDLVYTFGSTNPGALVLNNFPTALTSLSKPGMPFKLDISTIDLIRDRERGVPRYRKFRQLLGLTVPKSFSEVSDNPETVAALKAAYASIDDLDLMTGTLAESPRPEGYAFGETAFQLFVLMASRRLMTDRFLTTDYTAATYTQAGLDWIAKSSMADVLGRAFPELAGAVASVDNAFKPWKFGGPPVPREWSILGDF
ncbi:hypothetical protein HK101_000340 [Irineochytrium annulatum]|nr:hypothetical protein HK101_000340 [Irineochytrium annulatum]